MKKLVMWLIVALMTIAGSLAAMADEVPPAEAKPNVGYNKGFFIQNNEGSFVLKINGRFQPRFSYIKSTGSPSDATFRINSARLNFAATVLEKTSISFFLNHKTKSSKYQTMNIGGAAVSHEFDPAFTVTAGMVGLPFSLAGAGSSLAFLFPDPVLTETQEDGGTVTPGRSSFSSPDGLGVWLSGGLGKFTYEVGAVNGAAKTTLEVQDATGNVLTPADGGVETNYDLNFNNKVSLGARVSYDILESAAGSETDFPNSDKAKWTINIGSNYQGRRQDSTTAAIISRILSGTTGTQFKYKGLSLNAEVYGRRITISDAGNAIWFSNSMDDMAYYLSGGYFVIPNKLELALAGSQIFREGTHNDSYQFGSGVNWYIKNNNLKLQLAYMLSGAYSDITNIQTTKTHNILLQMTTSF